MQERFPKEKEHQRKLKLILRLLLVAAGASLLVWAGYFVFQQFGSRQAAKQRTDNSEFRQEEAKQKEAKETPPSKDQTPPQLEEQELLAPGKGVEVVKNHCTSCHSAKLIVQNRATREGWRSMIRWMQETQNLWELGENEEVILDYLSTHYPPEEKGRRENLKEIEWYILEENQAP